MKVKMESEKIVQWAKQASARVDRFWWGRSDDEQSDNEAYMDDDSFLATCPLPRPEMSPSMIPPSLHPPPPPPGYPVGDGGRVSGDVSTPGRTQSRGDGFWRGW
nr:cysteine-rich and transmembrane domain-containing protein A-like [Ipomoea trifida]